MATPWRRASWSTRTRRPRSAARWATGCASTRRATSSGRLGYPEKIAAAVAYLASDDGAFVTGETLRVDGGMTAHSPSHDTG